MKKYEPKRYTEKQKERALAMAKDIGITVAAKKLGISYTTLVKWGNPKGARAKSKGVKLKTGYSVDMRKLNKAIRLAAQLNKQLALIRN